jgi:rare lipoprotein A (peptidoglycan hydrolase)
MTTPGVGPVVALVNAANQANGHWAVVRITDRGPFIEGRIIDVASTYTVDYDCKRC